MLLDEGEDINTVTSRFKKNLVSYWHEVGREAVDDTIKHTGYIRWVQVGAVLAKTYGVKDYTGLTINGVSVNIPVTQIEYPVTGEVILGEA